MAEENTESSVSQGAETIPILNTSGSSSNSFTINANWLERDRGDQAVQDVIVAHLAARRQGSASSRNRALIRGGGAKPWRQKGTGRARSGTRTSPLWRGGGVIFGPTPRDYSKKVNAKVRKLALKRTFTSRVDDGDIILVDNLDLSEPKTKSMLQILNTIGAGDDVLIILDNKENVNLQLSARNLPLVEVMQARSVNSYQLLLHIKIVMTISTMEMIGSRLS